MTDVERQWRPRRSEAMLDQLRHVGSAGALTIVGVDGRSGSGKSRLATSLASVGHGVCVIHTDDIAWHHSFFGWADLLIDHVLRPLRRTGPPVSYRPQAWIDRARSGAIDVPDTADVLIVEGVGACRRELDPWLDATVWVDADPEIAGQRVVARGVDTQQFIDDWTAQENDHMAVDRPWTRADVLVLGTPDEPRTTGEYLTAEGPSRPFRVKVVGWR